MSGAEGGVAGVKPGPIGRVVRVLTGLVFLALLIKTLADYTDFVGPAAPSQPMRWLGILLCFYFLGDVVNLGFGRAWGRWPQLVVAFGALAAVVFDLARYGRVWGPPLGFVVFLLLAYVTGHLGLSFIIAGVSGAPG